MPELPDAEIFRAIVDQLDTAVYLVDRERKIMYWNRGAETVTGYLSQYVVGRTCRDNILVHCDDHNTQLCSADCPLPVFMWLSSIFTTSVPVHCCISS